VLSFSFDKGHKSLVPLVYHFVKVRTDLYQSLLQLGHVTYWLLVCCCMQPQVLYSTVLRCGLIGDHKSGEMKLGVSGCSNSTDEHVRQTGTTPGHWPAGNLCDCARQIILIVQHLDKIMLKSDTRFLRNPTAKLAR